MDTQRLSSRTPKAFGGVPADVHPGDGDRPLAHGKAADAEFETAAS